MGRPCKINTEEIALHTAKLLGMRLNKFEIRKIIEVKFNRRKKIAPRSFERVMAHAREILLEGDTKSRKLLRNEARQFYESIIADPKTPPSTKVKAQSCLDKLYGLPITRVIHSGTGEGGAIKHENKTTLTLKNVPTQELEDARLVLQRLRVSAGSNN